MTISHPMKFQFWVQIAKNTWGAIGVPGIFEAGDPASYRNTWGAIVILDNFEAGDPASYGNARRPIGISAEP